jgi:hypothetical protein
MTRETLKEVQKAFALQEEIKTEYERLKDKAIEKGLSEKEKGQYELLKHLIGTWSL